MHHDPSNTKEAFKNAKFYLDLMLIYAKDEFMFKPDSKEPAPVPSKRMDYFFEIIKQEFETFCVKQEERVPYLDAGSKLIEYLGNKDPELLKPAEALLAPHEEQLGKSKSLEDKVRQ